MHNLPTLTEMCIQDFTRSYVMLQLNAEVPEQTPIMRPENLHCTLVMINALFSEWQKAELLHDLSTVLEMMVGPDRRWWLQLTRADTCNSWNFGVDDRSLHMATALKQLCLFKVKSWGIDLCADRVIHISWC